VNADIDPVIGKKRGSDRLHRVFMAGDREKNDPLSVQCIGVSEYVKTFGLNGYQNTGSIVAPGRVVSPLRTHLHFGFSLKPFVSLIFNVGAALVFMGKKEGRNRSVRLGDYPNSYIVSGSIGAEDSEAIVNRKFIFSFILFTKLAPISRLMSGEKLKGILIRLLQCPQRAWGRDNSPQGKSCEQSIHFSHMVFHFGGIA
jgi:hypothetical protein